MNGYEPAANFSTTVIVLLLLTVFATAFTLVWAYALHSQNCWKKPTKFQTAVGFVTNFFDTLGIGSFATTTSLYRWRRSIDDEYLPGTLNVGHCLPTVVQAFIYISVVEVEGRTLVLMISAAVLGAWIGSSVVTRLSRRHIQLYLGMALLVAAAFLLVRLLNYLPSGGDALALDGPRLAIGMAANFVFGALMMIGVGAYAPIMILVSLLGMNPRSAFPIMMGSCAFLVSIGSLRFIRARKYDAAAAVGLTLGGIPAVLVAALFVQELPLDFIRWLVVAVVIYTAIGLLSSHGRSSYWNC